MKKLNIIVTSALCASLMAVSASAASNECVSVFDSVNKLNSIVNSVNISNCDPRVLLQNILSGCLNGQLPTLPEKPGQDAPTLPEAPEQEEPALPEAPEAPEQDAPIAPELPGQDDTTGGAGGSIEGSVSEFERRVVDLVNAERAREGLSALTLNEELSGVAREKSRDMQQNGYFSHTSPTYGSPFDMLRQFGISYNFAGENIAMGYSSPEAVVQGWMDSPGHRANIMSGSYTEIGVGHVANGNYWTQLFIG